MGANKDYQKIRSELANNEAVSACAERHGTIGDPSAMKICYLFRNHPELSVSEIASLVGLSVSAASRQLKKLKAVNILSSNKQAQTVYYSLEKNQFTQNLIKELSESRSQ
ncbi:winged helix-turn-helix transcriptional regulator [Candidatus Berkelbacteria bacterium]|nr:winged helix-turn-helix transcriptional regulator [Candidatus Berkelbacteria bacterium]